MNKEDKIKCNNGTMRNFRRGDMDTIIGQMNQETEQEKKYREEFDEYDITTNITEMSDYDIRETYYLVACKKRQEEIDRLRAEIEKLRIEKTADQILWQGEIDKLRAENKKLKEEHGHLQKCLSDRSKELKSYSSDRGVYIRDVRSLEDEIHRLKDLVKRAKPWVEGEKLRRMYWYPPEIYKDVEQWIADFKKEIGGGRMSEATEKHLEKIVLELRDGNTRYSIEVLELKNKLDCAVKALEWIGTLEQDEEFPATRISKAAKRARLALEEIKK